MERFPKNWNLQQKLDLELARRSTTAVFFFQLAATLAAFYSHTKEYGNTILGLSICVVLCNFGRLIGSQKLGNSPVYNPSVALLLKGSIAVNAIFYSILYNLLAVKLNYEGTVCEAMILVYTVSSLGSVISLSPSKWLGTFYQLVTLGPIVVITFWLHHTGVQPDAIYYSYIATISVLYCIRTGQIIRRDIVASIVFEESLLESQKRLAEETTKNVHASRLSALGEMAAGLGHELNNPLMVIQGHVISQKATFTKIKNDSIQSVLSDTNEKILKGISRAARIVKGLRLFSQQDEQLEKEVKTVSEIIDLTLDLCEEKLKASNIDIRVSVPKSLRITCKPVQLAQVFLNLLNNAYDAVMLSSSKTVSVTAIEDCGHIKIEVQDSGQGIPKDIRTKLFEPFVTSKQVGKGTGMGLSISKGIMKDHGGDIYLDESKKLTTFVVTLPAA